MFMARAAAYGRRMMLLGLSLEISACATVVGGTTQDITLQSDPPGAECKVDRQGANVGVVKPTPGHVIVPRSKHALSVGCALEGYEPATVEVTSSFSGGTVGNILVGGLIGVAVDAASGANNNYPERVIVVMTPASFPDETARDAFFAGVRERINAGTEKEVKAINATCSSTNAELCRIETKKVTDARDKALAELDGRRAAAKIAPNG